MGPIGCSETSVRNYHYSPRKNAEERSSLAHQQVYKSTWFFVLWVRSTTSRIRRRHSP